MSCCRSVHCSGASADLGYYTCADTSSDPLQHCAVPEYDLVVLGHTHHILGCKGDNTLLVNPGSIGQPRNRKLGASPAVFETAGCALKVRIEHYGLGALGGECKQRHPELSCSAHALVQA